MSRELLPRDLDAVGHRIFGLPAPASADSAVRLADLAFSVASYTALASIDGTILGTGVIRRAATTKRWFFLDKDTTRSAVDGEVIAATGGGWWVWMEQAEPFWLGQTSWTIDPSGGNDEGTGTTVKTFRELQRRLYGFNGQVSPVITLAGDIPTSDAQVLTSLHSTDAAHYVTILGTKTLVGTYTLTTYAAGDPTVGSGGTQFTLTATGIGSNGNVIAESMIDHLVIDPITGASAFILANLSANQAVIGEPTNADPSASQTVARGVVTPFTNGNTINVYRLSKLPIYPFPVTLIAPVLGWVTLQNPADSGIPSNNMMGATAPRLIQCNIAGGVFHGGSAGLSTTQTNKGVFAACNFSASVIEFVQNTSTIRSCSCRGAILSIGQSRWTCVSTFVMEASSVELSGAQFNAGAVCCFNSTDPGLGVGAFVADSVSQVQINGSAFWGNGNTDYAIYSTAGSVSVIKVTNLNWITNRGWDLWVAGQLLNFADIPTGKAMIGSAGAGVTDMVA